MGSWGTTNLSAVVTPPMALLSLFSFFGPSYACIVAIILIVQELYDSSVPPHFAFMIAPYLYSLWAFLGLDD